MRENKECKIVQDLLPNYIEKLTNEETNQFIEEHLKECDECKKVLENMQKDIQLNAGKQDKREVKYMKKYSNKMRVLKYILLALIVIYIAVVLRRTFIMFTLSEKAEENKSYDNYNAKIYSYQGDSLIITESYNKGGNYLTTMTRITDDGNQKTKLTFYNKDNEKIALLESGEEKYILNSETTTGWNVSPVTYVADSFLTNMELAFIIGVDSDYCNGKECYVIKESSYERYIDKETGLAIRNIDKNIGQNDRIVDYEYTFNTVEDSDIVKPDTVGYDNVET